MPVKVRREVGMISPVRGFRALTQILKWGMLVLACGLLVAQGAAAEDAAVPDTAGGAKGETFKMPTGEEAVAQIMTGLNERLALSDEQQTEIRPTVVDMVATIQKLRDKFKAGELKPMALGMQLQMAEKKASALIDPVLDEKQRVEYAALRQEQRRRMMQEMQKRAAAGQPPGF
ncbi:MAG: hypothetical protein VX252_09395 [Myxococcota bacterium]|nr:hypothetical protein [Myxococcota bacterium]